MGTIGERIKVARASAGWSLRELADRVGVSHTAISKYEHGLDVPSSDTLIRLAKSLDLRVEYFLRPVQVSVSPPQFRRRSAMSKKHEGMVLARIQEELERHLSAESLFPDTELAYKRPELGNVQLRLEDMELAAVRLREVWSLGLDPIDGLIWLLETRGIKVELVNAGADFDACTFWANRSIPVIAVRADMPGDRERMSLAHELAHLVLGLDGDRAAEKAAFRFAGAFLVPREMVEAELGKKRGNITLVELDRLKKKWGLSMSGWLRRAVDLGIISESKYVSYMKQFRREAWHLKEPGDPYPAEQPSRLEGLVLRALAEDLISLSRAGELLNRPINRADLQVGAGDGKPPQPVCS